MEVEFEDEQLQRVFEEADFTAGMSGKVVKGFRKAVGWLIHAVDERDIYQWRSLRFKKLKGDREGQHSLRLNDQYRLIVEIRKGNPKNTIVIKEIVDYH